MGPKSRSVFHGGGGVVKFLGLGLSYISKRASGAPIVLQKSGSDRPIGHFGTPWGPFRREMLEGF